MPDRYIRQGIIDSDRVNKLSWAAEVFYRRLMSLADDYGRYDARPDKLRGELFALRLDNVSKSDIVKWMHECCNAGLIRLYSTDGQKQYLVINDFGQRIRTKAKFPDPPLLDESDSSPTIDSNLLTTDSTGKGGGGVREIVRGGGTAAASFEEVFRRYASINYPDEDLQAEISKFKEKYVHITDPSQATALINTWMGNANRAFERKQIQQNGFSPSSVAKELIKARAKHGND